MSFYKRRKVDEEGNEICLQIRYKTDSLYYSRNGCGRLIIVLIKHLEARGDSISIAG